jgi:hypothetical protein
VLKRVHALADELRGKAIVIEADVSQPESRLGRVDRAPSDVTS